MEFYTLFKMKFMACQSCFACRTATTTASSTTNCSEALQKVKTADAVVVGSPIYHDADDRSGEEPVRPALPAADIDAAHRYKPRFGTKKMVTVYSQGIEDPPLFESYFEYTAALFPAFGFELVDNIVCTGACDPETAERDAELKIRAYEAGKALAVRPGRGWRWSRQRAAAAWRAAALRAAVDSLRPGGIVEVSEMEKLFRFGAPRPNRGIAWP